MDANVGPQMQKFRTCKLNKNVKSKIALKSQCQASSAGVSKCNDDMIMDIMVHF